MTMLASFVCDAYCLNGIGIRHMFCKQIAESDMFPLTSGTLKQHILRVHVQAKICDNRTLSPLQNGFCKYAYGDLVSHTTDDLPATKAIIEMFNCQCKGSCPSQMYGSRAHNAACIELCLCITDCQNNTVIHYLMRARIIL